jgi:hypothetical protein
MILYTTLYTPAKKERLNEIETCLTLNCDNQNIEKIIILFEDNSISKINHPKINLIKIDKRPTYNNFFELFEEEKINILVNSDIILNYEDTKKFKNIRKNEIYALTRYEIGKREIEKYDDIFQKRCLITDYTDSDNNDIYSCTSDTWVIYGKPVKEHPSDYSFELGVPGCEISMLYDFHKNNYKIYNPCLSIYTYHYHKDEDRSYYKKCYEFPRFFTVPSVLKVINNKNFNFYKINNKFSVSILLSITSDKGKHWKKFKDTPLFKTLKMFSETIDDDINVKYYISIKQDLGYENLLQDNIDKEININISDEDDIIRYKKFINKAVNETKDKFIVISKEVEDLEKGWLYKSIKKICESGENTLVKPPEKEFPCIVSRDYIVKLLSN